jgi:hypothetical protein
MGALQLVTALLRQLLQSRAALANPNEPAPGGGRLHGAPVTSLWGLPETPHAPAY